jgi:hypothetical protein
VAPGGGHQEVHWHAAQGANQDGISEACDDAVLHRSHARWIVVQCVRKVTDNRNSWCFAHNRLIASFIQSPADGVVNWPRWRSILCGAGAGVYFPVCSNAAPPMVDMNFLSFDPANTVGRHGAPT